MWPTTRSLAPPTPPTSDAAMCRTSPQISRMSVAMMDAPPELTVLVIGRREVFYGGSRPQRGATLHHEKAGIHDLRRE
jgi:hypothetical protein